jgi:hypothetical protein
VVLFFSALLAEPIREVADLGLPAGDVGLHDGERRR